MIELRRIVVIHDLRQQGLSVSEIARQMGLDRKTVRRLPGAVRPGESFP